MFLSSSSFFSVLVCIFKFSSRRIHYFYNLKEYIFNSVVYLYLLEDTEPNIHLTRKTCNVHGFHCSQHWKAVLWLESTEAVWNTSAIRVISSGPQIFLSLIGPFLTDKLMSFPGVPPWPRELRSSSLSLALPHFGWHLPFLSLSPNISVRVFVQNENSLFWGRVEGFISSFQETRETSQKMYVVWVLGENLIWQVEVQEGIWARGDCSAHTQCSSQRILLANLSMCLNLSVSLSKHFIYHFFLLEYSLLPCVFLLKLFLYLSFKLSTFKNNTYELNVCESYFVFYHKALF